MMRFSMNASVTEADYGDVQTFEHHIYCDAQKWVKSLWKYVNILQ